MSAEITIRIALGVLLLLVVGLVAVGVVGTRDVEEESKSTHQGGLSKEVQEVCEKARHDLRTGTAEGELDEVQRAALEDVIATECE